MDGFIRNIYILGCASYPPNILDNLEVIIHKQSGKEILISRQGPFTRGYDFLLDAGSLKEYIKTRRPK